MYLICDRQWLQCRHHSDDRQDYYPGTKHRNYNLNLSIGSLTGAGSLGLLIPPSIVMIVYSVQAEVSISKLFMAGVLPGLLIAVLYIGYVAIHSMLDPDVTPASNDIPMSVWHALGQLAPVLGLVVIVLGAIYTELLHHQKLPPWAVPLR